MLGKESQKAENRRQNKLKNSFKDIRDKIQSDTATKDELLEVAEVIKRNMN